MTFFRWADGRTDADSCGQTEKLLEGAAREPSIHVSALLGRNEVHNGNNMEIDGQRARIG